jgi:hypothetical protein
MIFGKKPMKKVDPALAVGDLRETIDRAVDRARNDGVRAYLIWTELENVAARLRMIAATTQPIL